MYEKMSAEGERASETHLKEVLRTGEDLVARDATCLRESLIVVLLELEGAVRDTATALCGLGRLVGEYAEVVVDAAHPSLAGGDDALDHPAGR